jgi:hypothetical protein
MPALPRMSLRSPSRFGPFELSSSRRAALRTTLHKFEADHSAANLGGTHFPGLRFHVWVPLLLLPLILVFLLVLCVARVFGSAVRWIVIWCGGFLAGGLPAWGLNAVTGAGYSPPSAWAAGGFLGLVVLSSLYGMCLEWLFWLSRHENNPYAGLVSLSPEQEAARVEFAKSLHWPTALASAAGGFLFALALFPIIAGTQTEWPSVIWWGLLGSLGLAVQGLLLGLYLGWKRNRVVFDASKHSVGEFVGWQIAGSNRGGRAACGWGLGYALHQLPAGAIAGIVLGGITHMFFA